MGRSSILSILSYKEQRLYDILLEFAQARKVNHVPVPRVVVITDLAKDYDDLAAMVVLKELHRLGLIKLEAFIANFEPARKRALYGRGALDSLGLHDVPIGVGTKASTKDYEEYCYEFEAPFMPDEKTFTPNKKNFFEDGFELLDQVFDQAIEEDQKLICVLISSLTDIAGYTKAYLEKAVARVYMQGGYSISAKDIPTPWDDAANNMVDMPAAETFHKHLENIPSDVYTKVAAYETKIPASIFNDLGDMEHPIGKDLQSRYQRQGLQYYKTACGPTPFNDITQQKFLDKFCGFYERHPPGTLTKNGTPLPEDGTPLPDPDTNEIIPYLTKGLLYDTLPALATGGDDLLAVLGVLDIESMANQTSIHKVIGTRRVRDDLSDIPNINPQQMAFVISTVLKVGLYSSLQNGPGHT